MKTYRLADVMTRNECDHFGVPRVFPTHYSQNGKDGVFIRARLTGEKRAPKAGEWYLSGAVPVAYRASNGFSAEYHILKLVKVKRETQTIETIQE